MITLLRLSPSSHPRRWLRSLGFAVAAWLTLAGSAAVRATEPGFELRGGHPYLMFTAPDIARFKERIAQDSAAAEGWRRLLAVADAAVEAKGGAAGRDGGPMEPLCLAYRMTGDAKYAQRIKALLNAQLQRPDFCEPYLLQRDPPWHSGLQTGGATYSFALGFDCIHDALTPDERKTFARGLVEKGIDQILRDWVTGDRRIHALDTMGHNWWAVTVFSAGSACIAVLDDEPRAKDWLRRIYTGAFEFLTYAGSDIETKPANFDREGGFYEDVNYAGLAISEYLRFRLTWQNAFRSPEAPTTPVVAKFSDYFTHVAYRMKDGVACVFFGDGGLHANGRHCVELAWANGFKAPRALWYLRQFGEPGAAEAGRGGERRPSALSLVYGPTAADWAKAPAQPDLPPSMLFPDMGWATLRSGWQDNATLLGVKSGFTWNHAHADAGSFVLFHGGDYLLIDGGGSPGYARPEYDGYYRQSKAHNVVLFNGQAEFPEDTYHGSQFPGRLSNLIDSGDLKYVLADATGPTTWRFVRNFRQFLWVGDVVLIIDDVKSYEPGQFEWQLHTGGKVTKKNLDLEVAGDSASVLVRPLFPQPLPGNAGLPTDYPERMRLVEKTGPKDHDVSTQQTYYSFLPADQTRRTKFIVAVILVNDQNRNELPQLERLETTQLNGVRIRQQGKVTDVYLNLLADGSIRHRNANANLFGWETDAYLTAFTYADGANPADPDQASRVFVADGSYLRRDGKVVLDSLSKVFATWSAKDGALDVVLQGQPVQNVFLRAPKAPAQLRVNGVSRVLSYDAPAQAVQITTQR